MKYYINVPFTEKDQAKALGASWDAEARSWYYTDPADNILFERWEKDSSQKPKQFMTLSQLSDEQQEFVNIVKTGKNVLVDACIGSGKTTAIQVLCNEIADKNILYLTYNNLLKVDAKEKIVQKNVMVQNYHGFAFLCLKKANIPTGVSDIIQNFIQNEPALINHYDMIVIDEYQDIEQEIAEMLWLIKEALPNIQIVAVGDMKQKIYDKTTLDVPEFIDDFLEEYTLLHFTKCFRLNKELAAKLGRIWEKDIKGVNTNCRTEIISERDVLPFLEKLETKDILCLGSRFGNMADVLNKLESRYPEKFNKNTVYASITDEDRQAISPSSDNAIFTTYDASKGLERKYCFVFDFTEDYWYVRTNQPMQKYEILRNIFCVAASRGKSKVIFVKKDREGILSEETLSEPTETKMGNKDYLMSEMFDFKYKEDVEACYRLVKRKKIKTAKDTIEVQSADGLIDLSPCIGIFQEAAFFENYDIDSEIEFAYDMHPDKPKMQIPTDATVETKVLYMTAYETCYNRYATQVKAPFLTPEQKEAILDRLRTQFNGKERVQESCSITFLGNRGEELQMRGRCDVIKNDMVYELKFVSELGHEHFLQLASYLVAMGYEKGILWNVKNNEMYEVTVPDRKKFMDAVVRTITKGIIKTCDVYEENERRFFRSAEQRISEKTSKESFIESSEEIEK